jgi:diketogulonate reductase-like aldo/keto reductase
MNDMSATETAVRHVRPAHLADNVAAAALRLSPEDMKALTGV